jgi:protocatechuate 3,4-dioxygenase alpha subunit
MSDQTPSQTVGPFFHVGLIQAGQENLVEEGTRGQRILVRGRVLDGEGAPVPDAMLEIWQADAGGIYNHPADPRRPQADSRFPGFGRAATDENGEYQFKTVKPGPVPGDDGQPQAPHINLRVFARGMLIHATTRLYFPDEAANRGDPVLAAIPDAERRSTLLATVVPGQDLPTYRFDVVLQGEKETAFFDFSA